MTLWISKHALIIFCKTTEARLHVPLYVNKSKSISRTEFVKVLLWNEFLPYTHTFSVGLVRSRWILLCCQAGKANMVTQISHPSFIQNSMQIEKEKRFAWETVCFGKKGVLGVCHRKEIDWHCIATDFRVYWICKSGW